MMPSDINSTTMPRSKEWHYLDLKADHQGGGQHRNRRVNSMVEPFTLPSNLTNFSRGLLPLFDKMVD
jgi:hypothetical protein